MANVEIENVSDTALWVAAFRAQETARPDALYKDTLAAMLAGERGQALAKMMPYGSVIGWVMVVRTVAIDRLITDTLSQGVDTVINLGAGLDTRPYRMALPKDLDWIEVDFPHMVQFKNEKLANQKPQCHLTRIGLDLANRPAAQALFRQLGAKAKKALILTEGVVPYLTVEQGGNLADDLRAIASFQFWIQDYRRGNNRWQRPKRLRKKLLRAPFQFDHPEPLTFFGEHGWKVAETILAVPEGERLGRKFPVPFPWNLLAPFTPKAKWEEFRQASGYVLFRAG